MDIEVNNWSKMLAKIEQAIFAGENITFDQALTLSKVPDERVDDLAALALRVRRRFCAEKLDLCAIINARSGRCAEDCKFCAQSTKYGANAAIYPMKSVETIVAAAKNAEVSGAHRFCIVTSGVALNDRDFSMVLKAIDRIRAETSLDRCASIGRLTADRARQLKTAGLNRYHHNIETARSFFPAVCTTHTYDEKVQTVKYLKSAGIETCVGGILNVGETAIQRLELAFELRALEPDSVPVNFLNPRPGTPLAGRSPMAAAEAAKFLAILRLVMPRTFIRLAGGRLETFNDQPELPFTSGANALLIGDLLTTKGSSVDSDLSLLQSLGFELTPDDEHAC